VATRTEAHVPVERLPGGDLTYAPIGTVMTMDAGAALICHACGQALAHVSAGHLRQHGLTQAQYRRRLGLNRKHCWGRLRRALPTADSTTIRTAGTLDA
jgi:hypothetical protein